jgi:hypothetical protein
VGMGPTRGARRKMGSPRRQPCEPRPVQVRYETILTSGEYVTRQAWRQATLGRCPLHPDEPCGVSRHGTYARVEPPGALVARFYCRRGQTTFSLLPDCLASRLSSSQDEVEQVVVAAEGARSQEEVAAALRPDISLPSALRWLRRRLGPVRATVLALVTMVPALQGVPAQLRALRRTLGSTRALVALRGLAAKHLHLLAPPIGFGPRPRAGGRKRRRSQQQTGPAPPRLVR